MATHFFLFDFDFSLNTSKRLEYVGQSPACDDGNCRGPHYCSKEAADAGIWGKIFSC